MEENREAKRTKYFESGSLKGGRLEIKDKPIFKKRFSNRVTSKFTKVCYNRVSNAKSQKGRGTSSLSKKPTCAKCGKKHLGEFLVGMDNCFGCGKSFHKVRD